MEWNRSQQNTFVLKATLKASLLYSKQKILVYLHLWLSRKVKNNFMLWNSVKVRGSTSKGKLFGPWVVIDVKTNQGSKFYCASFTFSWLKYVQRHSILHPSGVKPWLLCYISYIVMILFLKLESLVCLYTNVSQQNIWGFWWVLKWHSTKIKYCETRF